VIVAAFTAATLVAAVAATVTAVARPSELPASIVRRGQKCHKLPRIALRTRAPIGPKTRIESTEEADRMEVADLVLPVFAVIVTGWLAGWLGYISRSLADGLVHFAYNVAMPALLFITVAQEPARNLLEWRFLMAFGGGSVLCFALVFLAVRIAWGRDLASSTIQGMTASMTNTGFVALPILHSIYGQPAVLPAAIATVFVAAVMFPASVILLESEGRSRHGSSGRSIVLGARPDRRSGIWRG
jgi:hypothetical protein